MLLADRTKKMTPPGTSRMREIANDRKRAGIDVINFAAGELDGDASEVIKSAAKLAIDEGCNKYTPTLGMKELREPIKQQTVLVNSFSKSHAVTGWRIGYACGPRNVISAMENFQGHTTSNPCSISQRAATAALKQDDGRFIKNVNAVLDKRLHIAMAIVNSMKGITCAPAAGAFYLFLNVERTFRKTYKGRLIADVAALCELILSEANVALVSGDAFGDPTGVRVSYAIETDQVEEGLYRMKRLFDSIV